MSHTLAVPAAEPDRTAAHFGLRLATEVVPWDVFHDQHDGVCGFVLLDARTPAEYRDRHLPGAISLPHQDITALVAARLDRAPVYICYGWGPACNAGTRAAAKLAGFGLKVKEMVGGIEYWQRADYPVEIDRASAPEEKGLAG